ncbi:hypothetical protein [Acidaminococcus timonensis]|uniref:hypothetical protein n=1 Tax=Acidaminococcus timonensis TaxID=1871002 RepID=UPI00307A635F
MDVSLGDIVAVLTLLGGALVWVIHVIISPLKILLDRVVQSLDKLDKTLTEERARREQIEIRLEAIEARGKINTHRIDDLEETQKKCLSKSLIN